MFIINMYTKNNVTWHSNVCFRTFNEAKHYLISQGFKEENRWFKRVSNGWYGDSKAIISPLEFHKNNEFI